MNVRIADQKDINKICNFLDNNWKKNHILSKDKKLLKWQHISNKKNKISFAVLENKTKKILGLIGFISINAYKKIKKKDDNIWLGIWCVSKEINKIYGLKLIYFFLNNTDNISIGGIGLTKDIMQLYNKLEFNTGEMRHYFIKNDKIHKAKLSKYLVNKKFKKVKKNTLEVTDRINKNIFSLKKKSFKNYNYFKYRYENHPYYNYKFINIKKRGEDILLIVFRKIFLFDTSILRIIDSFGYWEKAEDIGILIRNLLYKENSEYIDFLYKGRSEKYIENNGFNLKKGIKVIPNHFEPFEGVTNQPLYFCFKSRNEYELHKGDADSDRPNLLIN